MTIWNVMQKFGFVGVAAVFGGIAALGAFKLAKEWLPW